jgi:hypothetical protein
MKSITHLSFLSVLALSSALTACGGSSDSSGTTTTPTVNNAPVVNAGTDQTVTVGAIVQLDASVSDTDGDTLTITWSQTSGMTVMLSSTSTEDPSFTAPDVTSSENLIFDITASDGTATTSDTVTITVNDGTPVSTSEWIVNSGGETSNYVTDGGNFVEVDVLSVTQTASAIRVETKSVPSYNVEVTQEILDWYNDYNDGAYATVGALTLGRAISFGEDIGLAADCANGGDGWWPSAGGGCVNSSETITVDIPTVPEQAMTECKTGAGPVGIWLNGVFIYNWTDTFSYRQQGVWNHYAVAFRSKGMDVCLGHAGRGPYHHHTYNDCIRQEVGDEGEGHSPLYGYSGDGYPIHGPYHAADVLTQSCWKKRDYSESSPTGCGAEGVRSCQYVDQTDISLGFQNVTAGPTTSELVNADAVDVPAETGFYLEDYYYDATCTAQGDQYLDEHNGHDHDELGYHYHTSVDDDKFATFPLAPAVSFKGQASGYFTCSE